MPRGIPAGFGGKGSEGQEAYERKWLEIEPQGHARNKPLRGWETLRAECAGEASRHDTIRGLISLKGTKPQGGVLIPCASRSLIVHRGA